MTESKIKLVSEIMREKDEALAEKDAEILALKQQLAELQEKKNS